MLDQYEARQFEVNLLTYLLRKYFIVDKMLANKKKKNIDNNFFFPNLQSWS